MQDNIIDNIFELLSNTLVDTTSTQKNFTSALWWPFSINHLHASRSNYWQNTRWFKSVRNYVTIRLIQGPSGFRREVIHLCPSQTFRFYFEGAYPVLSALLVEGDALLLC